MTLRTSDSSLETEVSELPCFVELEFHLKRILCPTDFSECSRKALRYASTLAKQFKSEVFILHVLEPAPPQVAILESALMDTSLPEEMATLLEKWRQEVSPEVSTRVVLRPGTPPYKHIVSVAKEFNVDLIVLGNHGRNILARTFLGATAEKVVRFAPSPVMVIREREHEFLANVGANSDIC